MEEAAAENSETFENRSLDGEGDMENKGCCCGDIDENLKDNPKKDEGCCFIEDAEVEESSENTLDTQKKTKKESKIFGKNLDTYELFTDGPEEDEGCGCGCGVEPSDESTIDNPDEAKTMVEADFLQKFEKYAHSIGVTSLGYTKVPSELIITKEHIPYQNAVVLTLEMSEELIGTTPGPEAEKMNELVYEKLGNLTYKLSDYLRENGFATQVAHPHGSMVNFSGLGQEAGLGLIGQSGLLITPEVGPGQKISAIFTSIEDLPIKEGNDHVWITEYCEKCGKCIKACPEKALIEKEGCCGNKEIEFVQKLCIGCSQGCTYCIESCPFNEKGYKYIKNRFDKMNAKLKEKEKFKGDIMVNDEDKAFEAEIKAKYSGGTCPCQMGVLEKKKSSLKEVVCKKCGAVFKTNRDTDYCWRCEKK